MKNRARSLSATCILLGWLILLSGCGSDGGREGAELSGPIMGTRYSVKIAGVPAATDREQLASKVQAELELINSLMSTYDPQSELSRFNAFAGTEWFGVSRSTLEVVGRARSISEKTGGAFDVTVGPLVNLWGFGPEPEPGLVPSPDLIAAQRARVGYARVELREEPPALRKGRPDVYVDLSAIAKGYAVDRVAGLLEKEGLHDYLVDVGGEIRVAGDNAAGEPWRLAVEYPDSGRRAPFRIIRLERGGVATSGNYRNFFELEGQRYAHTIDPRSGWPVSHALLAVTVISDDTMTADAWATALMVLGPEEGLAVAEREGVAALLISAGDDSKVHEQMTSGMRAFLD